METKTQKEISTIVELWKKNNIAYAEFHFDCGGDSMNETRWEFYANVRQEHKCKECGTEKVHISVTEIRNEDVVEIENYLDGEVFKEVEFYECSDGHYQGENGIVKIELDDDGEDFTYDKSATALYSSINTELLEISLNEEEGNFLKEYVQTMGISQWGTDVVWVYSKDVFLSKDRIELIEDITKKIEDEVNGIEFEGCEDAGHHSFCEPNGEMRWEQQEVMEAIKQKEDGSYILLIIVTAEFNCESDANY